MLQQARVWTRRAWLRAHDLGSEFWYTEVGDREQSVRRCSTLAEFRQASRGWKQLPGLNGKTGKQSSCAKGALK